MPEKSHHRAAISFGRLRAAALLLALCLLFLALTACASTRKKDDGALNIVCTTFPHYDWMRRIVGDSPGVSLTLLITNGTDPHSYEPTISDIATLSDSDMVILVGGESDTWVKEALRQAENPTLEQICLTDLPHVTLREITAESGHGHGHDHGHSHEENDRHANVFDEHIWLSLRNAMACVEELARLLTVKDPSNAETYQRNATAYLAELRALDEAYTAAVAAAPRGELLFADRFPFIYLTEDYGLHVHAAFEGCTTDVSASFETIVGLAEAAEEMRVTKITVTENSDQKLAKAVIRACENDSLEIVSLDSMQSITESKIKDGETYLSMMQKNLQALVYALSE